MCPKTTLPENRWQFLPQREPQRGSDRRVSIFANGGMLAPNRNGDKILSRQSASFHAD
jgi:hypothetical protein